MCSSQEKLKATLIHLGDQTSKKLEFSYQLDVPISYGEETITETNLLDLALHHPDIVHLRTFTKRKEATTGADWEWHVVGRINTLKMRVQAKRVTSDNFLKIRYSKKGSGKQQRDVLIDSAIDNCMRPMYCIYSTEFQRKYWNQGTTRYYQAGCLLADARSIPVATRGLDSIETECWPWHFLFGHPDSFLNHPLFRKIPTIVDLNEDTGRLQESTGIKETTPEDIAMVADEFHDYLPRFENIERDKHIVAFDVRELELPHINPSEATK